MKQVLLFGLFAFVLLFGCLSQQPGTASPTAATTATPTATVQAASSPTAQASTAAGCAAPDLKFGTVTPPESPIYGSKYPIGIEVIYTKSDCKPAPTTATIALYEGTRKLGESTLSQIAEKNSVNLDFVPDQSRKFDLTLKLSSNSADENKDNNEYQFSVIAEPFGYFSDVSGAGFYGVTMFDTRAQGFRLEQPMAIKEVQIYAKKGANFQPSDIYVEIRRDGTGKPSGTSEIRFSNGGEVIPGEYAWVAFMNPQKATLQPGMYWLVVRTLSLSTNLQLHMIPNTIFQKPEYTMKSSAIKPDSEVWVVATDEGVFNFKLGYEAPEVYDQGQLPVVSKPPSDFDPYSVV
ncbi:MAG: hypothetical protein V1835_01850 [Candidatus Micrarchaeota archaeon]